MKEELTDEELRQKEQNKLVRQQTYTSAIVKAKPGLGDGAVAIAQQLANAGLDEGQALALIDLVYNPKRADGNGQGTRLKYFSQALITRYGSDTLQSYGNSLPLFKGFLFRLNEAIAMRDEYNNSGIQASMSFEGALRFEDLSIDPRQIFSYVSDVSARNNISETAAYMRVKEASKIVERGERATIEALLFGGYWPAGASEEDEENEFGFHPQRGDCDYEHQEDSTNSK